MNVSNRVSAQDLLSTVPAGELTSQHVAMQIAFPIEGHLWCVLASITHRADGVLLNVVDESGITFGNLLRTNEAVCVRVPAPVRPQLASA